MASLIYKSSPLSVLNSFLAILDANFPDMFLQYFQTLLPLVVLPPFSSQEYSIFVPFIQSSIISSTTCLIDHLTYKSPTFSILIFFLRVLDAQFPDVYLRCFQPLLPLVVPSFYSHLLLPTALFLHAFHPTMYYKTALFAL